MNPKAYRLPTRVLPRRYDIDIDARLGREEFGGKVTIRLDVNEPTSSVELHARELQITEACLTLGGKELKGKVEPNTESEMAAINFDETIPAGEATLGLTFNGKVSQGLEGLYLAQDGPEKCLCTQCEETDARAIFPCFDEPTFKAQFAWRVTTDPDVTVLTNGPLQSVEESDTNTGQSKTEQGKSKTWTFAPTKPMSSYLVALVIGDVSGTPEEVVNGKPVRVWALTGKEQMGQFAHEYTKRLLPWFEEYFGVPYHYDKYDQVAVPGFAAGAMENSGLVLFRQQYLLMNPQTASWEAEKVIAHVVAHEFAHMWFGNLVTMKWWDDLWLNESFAEWISYKAVNALSPDYKLWNDFQAAKNSALASDALESTHPIYSHVETAAEIAELFDNITYEKGCAVMRMLENFLGEEAFRSGLRTYMKEFGESNAEGGDLWRHLETAAGQPVTAIMESWVNQEGYPVLNLSLDGSTLWVSQQRFYSSPSPSNTRNQLWHVPLVVRYEDDRGVHETRSLLEGQEGTVELEAQGAIKWVYSNSDEIGFYRQNPDRSIVQGILANLDKLTPLEQMGLLSDQWALVRNGTNKITSVLDVLSSVSSIDDYSVLRAVVGRLHGVEELLETAGDPQALNRFRAWVKQAFQEKLNRLGYEPKEGESQNDAQSRQALIDAVVTIAQDEDAITQATTWAEKEAENAQSVDPNLAGTFVSAAAQFGDRERFDRYVKIYEDRRAAGASPQETNRYLNSMPNFRKPELVKQVFQLLDDQVLPQEARGPLLRTMLAQTHAQEEAWEYLKKNWVALRSLGDMWTNFLVAATGYLPASRRADMVEFYNKTLNGLAEKSYARALETLDQQEEFKQRTKDDLVSWFKNR
ncbi:MAG TPA: M1 family metallopeptidase [Chloroflexia bacterium]|nr:M1 family metallopeptidase [Chloroflexia bacterium]